MDESTLDAMWMAMTMADPPMPVQMGVDRLMEIEHCERPEAVEMLRTAAGNWLETALSSPTGFPLWEQFHSRASGVIKAFRTSFSLEVIRRKSSLIHSMESNFGDFLVKDPVDAQSPVAVAHQQMNEWSSLLKTAIRVLAEIDTIE